MKTKYKYFGSGEIQAEYAYFHKFGQELALTDAEAYDCVRSGGLIRSEDFDTIGWTPMEKTNKHYRKGPEFEGRLKLAMEKRSVLIDALAASLATPAVQEGE